LPIDAKQVASMLLEARASNEVAELAQGAAALNGERVCDDVIY
jgi:hypothetical protein